MRQEQPQVVALQQLHPQQQRLLAMRQEQPQVVALQQLHPRLLRQLLHLQPLQQQPLHHNQEGKH
jgi:hypothetical protein